MRTVEWTLCERAPDLLLDELDLQGVLLVQGLPLDLANGSLLKLALLLGMPLFIPPAARDSHCEHGIVHRVERRETPVMDRTGDVVLSTTSGSFPLHTDCAQLDRPPNIVLLHCWKPSEEGGESLFADGQQVASRLSYNQRRLLEEEVIHHGTSTWPVLHFNETDQTLGTLRWSPELVNLQAIAEGRREQLREAVDAFADAARDECHSLALGSGDVLILNNHRFLHGRTSFPAKSKRLLKRMRVFSGTAEVGSK